MKDEEFLAMFTFPPNTSSNTDFIDTPFTGDFQDNNIDPIDDTDDTPDDGKDDDGKKNGAAGVSMMVVIVTSAVTIITHVF